MTYEVRIEQICAQTHELQEKESYKVKEGNFKIQKANEYLKSSDIVSIKIHTYLTRYLRIF
jgi:hypothetical protein